MNAAKVNSPPESAWKEGRGQQSSFSFKGEWHNTACSEKSRFWQAKKVVFYTTNETF